MPFKDKGLDNIEERILKEDKERLLKNIKALEDENKKLLERISSTANEKEIYETLYNLKENHRKLKLDYKHLGNYTSENYSNETNDNLCKEIYYFEKCLKMLIEIKGIIGTDPRHYLDCAVLEYDYFIKKKSNLSKMFHDFIPIYSELTPGSNYCLILKNLKNAQFSVMRFLEAYEKENKIKELFLFHEVLGDIFIQEYTILIDNSDNKKIENDLTLYNAYYNYHKSVEYKTELQRKKPQTYIMGLRDITYLPTFYDFFKDYSGDLYDVQGKKKFIETQYSHLKQYTHPRKEILIEKGKKYFNEKDFTNAIDSFLKIIKFDPLNTEILNYIGKSYESLKNSEEAKKFYQKAIDIDPNQPETLINIGNYYLKIEEKEKAEKNYKKVIELDPNAIEIWKDLGKIYLQKGDLKNALSYYQKAIEINPKDRNSWKNLGDIYKSLSKYNESINSYQKIIEINQDDSEIRDKLYRVKKIIDAKKIISELPITYQEISFSKIVKKTEVDLADLENLIENMIKDGDISAKIKGNLILFEDVLQKEEKEISEKKGEIIYGRNGVWEANIFKFKVKIINNSENVITDILIILDSFPSGFQLIGSRTKTIKILHPNGELWTPEFKLNAGDECVSGKIRASIRYLDYQANSRLLDVRPFEISYICPLMEAKKIEEIEYLRKTRNMFIQEKRIRIDEIRNIPQFMVDIKKTMENMNLAIINIKGNLNELSGYAEDKIKHDGLALETKVGSMINGQTEIIIKAICENKDKCSPLLYQIDQKINQIQLSLEKGEIMQKLDLFIDKPRDLKNYIKRVVNSSWSDEKKDKWAVIIKEILEEWKGIKPRKWETISKVILNFFMGRVVGEELAGLLTAGIYDLIEWIKSNI